MIPAVRRDGRRLSARARGYTRAWEKARATHLATNPLCVMCLARGFIVPARVVDHVIAHRGDRALFWDRSNWQSLCKDCHDAHKQAEEIHGYSDELGLDGWPTDPRHPANGGSGRMVFGYSIPHGVQPSGVPVTLVSGPPGAGKSTYIRARTGADDIVVDFDDLLSSVGGRKWDNDQLKVRAAFRQRDAILRGLAGRRTGRAWVIAVAPTGAERRAWCRALGKVDVVVLDVDAATCKQRIAADPRRTHAIAAMNRSVDLWWQAFSR